MIVKKPVWQDHMMLSKTQTKHFTVNCLQKSHIYFHNVSEFTPFFSPWDIFHFKLKWYTK